MSDDINGNALHDKAQDAEAPKAPSTDEYTKLRDLIEYYKNQIAYRTGNAKYLAANVRNPQNAEYYRGYGNGFHEALINLQRLLDGKELAPVIQATMQMMPGRFIFRVGPSVIDVRDPELAMQIGAALASTYGACERENESDVCDECDAEALKIVLKYSALHGI